MAMMWWAQGWSWAGWLGMSLAMLVFWGTLIWLIVSLTGTWSKPDAPSSRRSAEQVGDITAVQYQDRLGVLRGNPGGQTPGLRMNDAPQ